MKFVLLALFLADSAVNVAACAAGLEKLRRATKVLLMPLLLGVYFSFAGAASWITALGVVFGWIGDIFLIFKAKAKLLAIGMASFGLGHILYVAAYFAVAGVHPPLWAAIVLPVALIGAGILVVRSMRAGIPVRLRGATFGYVTLLCGAASVAGMVAFGGSAGGWAMFAGALFFLASDGILSLETFVKGDSPKYDFAVMLTYIVAQSLIVLGFIMV